MTKKLLFAVVLNSVVSTLPACAASSPSSGSTSDYTAPVPVVTARAADDKVSAQVVSPSARQDLPMVSVAEDFLTAVISLAQSSKAQKGKLDVEAKKRLKDASTYVDIVALSQRALGKRWGTLPKAQRDEFIATLNEILEEVVYPQALKISAKSDEFTYKLDPKSKNAVLVHGAVERERLGEMIVNPFEMKLEFNAKTKRIVDAVIEKEAISGNLKRQFDRALEKREFSAIIDLMKKRVAKARQAKGAASGV